MRSVLIFTTAGKTFATAKTDGSEAGSACAKEDVDLAKMRSAATSARRATLGSACGLACSAWRTRQAHVGRGTLVGIFSAKRAREARVLPKVADIAFIVARGFLLESAAAFPDALRRCA